MNWTETVIGALAVFVAGMAMGADAALRAAAEVAQIGASASIVEFGGLAMKTSDFVAMMVLTASCSAVAAGVRFVNWRAALINFGLGIVFGVLGPQIVIVLFALDNSLIFGLAPATALFAAKIARALIHDDAVVKAALSGLARRFDRDGGK